MRIISGNFKGKKILEPKDVYTRPLKDLTKESIFNIINHSNIPESVWHFPRYVIAILYSLNSSSSNLQISNTYFYKISQQQFRI